MFSSTTLKERVYSFLVRVVDASFRFAARFRIPNHVIAESQPKTMTHRGRIMRGRGVYPRGVIFLGCQNSAIDSTPRPKGLANNIYIFRHSWSYML